MQENLVQITRNRRTEIEPAEIADLVELTDEEAMILDSLADLLEYPIDDWNLRFDDCRDLFLSGDLTASEHFSEFCFEIRNKSMTELQELYTRTFDLSPVCALEVGYHLFGEDYKRGAFLAQLRETESEFDLGQAQQLPDYLPVLLRLLGRMNDAELRSGLIGFCLIPGLGKMNECFKEKPNPYRHVIRFAEGFLSGIARRSMIETEKVGNARCEYV